jgi:hypothetical protein|tara:strand:- start:931 stop:1053 length:123 start_codon:yes stop_codon:yes gene_type:complete
MKPILPLLLAIYESLVPEKCILLMAYYLLGKIIISSKLIA